MTNDIYKNERVWQNTDHSESSSYNDHIGPGIHQKKKKIPIKKREKKKTPDNIKTSEKNQKQT